METGVHARMSVSIEASWPPAIPPLEAGDRLTRDEFERRYEAMPQLKKAELIEGVVYMPSPVRYRAHGGPHALITAWLSHYWAATPEVQPSIDTTVRLDLDNEPQPDALLRIDRGGQSRTDADDYLQGAPELVAEIAASSASYDLHVKKQAYRRNGVCEYVVWRTLDRALDWFVLRGGRYDELAPGPDGLLRSEAFPGLWLDSAALLASDLSGVLRALEAGLGSPEHAAFRRQLTDRPADAPRSG